MSSDTLLYEIEAGVAAPGFTETELRAIVEAASMLWERLGPRFEPVAGSPPDEKRLVRWCQVVAKGDWALFRKRLRWDGLDLEQARDAVRPARLRASSALPAWTSTLNGCLAAIEGTSSGLPERFCDEDAPIPFEHLLAPVVCAARRMVHRQIDGLTILLSEDALGDLERHLLNQLSARSARVLHVHFSVFKATSHLGSANHHFSGEAEPPDAAYQAFIASMRAGEMRSFFQQYSVLSRKVAVCVDNWVTNTVGFLKRLHADWAAIRQVFSDHDPGRVSRIESGMSDPHRGEQTTHIVHCESGLRIVYKPKNMGLGMAVQHMIEWCNDHGMEPALRPLRMLGRPDYGWVEYVSIEACHSPAEARRYFQRAGGLLALAYLLNGKDLHHQNVIACGDQPMLIDLELFMVPPLLEFISNENGFAIGDEEGVGLEDSALGTLLLPRWFVDESRPGDVIVRNLAGFADVTVQTCRPMHWTHTNTDRMGMMTSRRDIVLDDNVPRLDGKTLCSSDYVEEIQEGFERVYRIVREHVDELTQEGGVLSQFAQQPVRFMFRSTPIYGKLMRGLWHPRYLSNGIDASIEREALVRAYLRFTMRPPYWPIIRAEQQDLSEDDIPLFKTYTTSTSVFDAAECELGVFFLAPGLEAVRARLQVLDDEDLRFQKDLIWAAFYTQQVDSVHDGLSLSDATHPSEHGPLLTDTLARHEALRILERLRRTAVRGEHGGLSWITFSNTDPRIKRYQVRRIGHDLFHGRCGLALFLAACNHLGESRAIEGEMIRDTLRPLIDGLKDEPRREELARGRTIGGTYGLGAYVYALTQIGALLKDDGTLDHARAAASLITEEAIEKDQHLDVMFGAAGAALGLLTLYRATGDEDVLAKAERCGDYLLQHREVEPESKCRAWRTEQGRFMTGFSHGAAGIAHALAELYRATGNRAYLEAALEAFVFERSLFVPEVNNWLPYRSYLEKADGYDALWSTWCRGATGIGLARLANLDLFSDAERKDVEVAIEATQTHLLRGVDHPCCGVMGRVAFLMTAAETLHRPDLARVARSAAGHVVARAREHGTYTLTRDGQDKLRPGFFQGLSGIGYQLIKLVNTEELPSVLLLR